MSALKSFTDEELELELKQRKEERMKLPYHIGTFEMIGEKMVKYCDVLLAQILEEKYNDDDNRGYLWEFVLHTLYGDNIFELIRSWTDE